MGCGISKIDPEEAEGRPASAFKRLPKRNVNANVDNPVISEKVIENAVKDEEADHFVNHFGRKSVSSSPVEAKGNGCVDSEQDIQAMNGKKADWEEKDQRGVGKLDDNDRVSAAKAMAADDNEEGEESFQEDNRIFFIGSPSFREYCVDFGSSKGRNNAKEENDSRPGERPLNCEKAAYTTATEERSLSSKKVHTAAQERSKISAGTNKKSSRKGFQNAIHRPAGWISKKEEMRNLFRKLTNVHAI